jgi:opine dehydrogenase
MIFAVAARDAGNRARLSFAETGTLPWLARKHGPFDVAITIRAKRLPVGVFPLKRPIMRSM